MVMGQVTVTALVTATPQILSAVAVEVQQMAKPQVTDHAEMLEGSPEEVAEKICELLAKRGLL